MKQRIFSNFSNSDYENNFGVCSALGTANPKIGFLKVKISARI